MFDLNDHDLFKKELSTLELNSTSLLDRFTESEQAFDYLIEKGYDNWIVTFSGGKDSTTVLVLALEYALRHPDTVKRMDVVYSDTLIEIPSIHQFAKSILRFLKKFKREKGLNVITHVTSPAMDERFWVKTLGYGYPPPHQMFRWCTRRLKIEPVEERLKKYFKKDQTAILTGVRYGESRSRDERLNSSCSRGGECGQGVWFQHSEKLNVGYLAPIINWKSCEVWDFLAGFAPRWGYPVLDIQEVYNGQETRFGCWMCTVVKQDKAMEKTIAQDKWAHLKPMADFRNEVWDSTRDPKTRIKKKDGTVGKLRLNIRKNLMTKLLEVQSEVGMELISTREIAHIKRIWNK